MSQVRQHEIPPGKYALISVRQPRGQLVAVQAQPATENERPPRKLSLWQDCDIVQVYYFKIASHLYFNSFAVTI